jgi:aqualysin 1
LSIKRQSSLTNLIDLIVVFKRDSTRKDRKEAEKQFKSFGAKVKKDSEGVLVFNLLDLSEVTDQDGLNSLIQSLSVVDYVESEGILTASDAVYYSAADTGYWGNVYASARSWPGLPSNYLYPSSGGQGVRVYCLDTGLNFQHVNFTGKVPSSVGRTFAARTTPVDQDGHGTHVGSTILQIAPKASLIPYRVFDRRGGASISTVIAAIDASLTDCGTNRCIINMSLGGLYSQALNDAVERAYSNGILVVVAAGNENQNACNVSPASAPNAITVGATGGAVTTIASYNPNTSANQKAPYSNWGTCVDINAGGTNQKAAWIGSTTAMNTISGTSMAAPKVAGVAALFWSQNLGLSAAQIRSTLLSQATSGVITGLSNGTPNLLLYNGGAA